ncbi:MAG: arginine deiminase-related protein [Kiritimatiellae bacterium]|nr:arginine deiminase-related protein [Kiritimatiellia bacterium]
MLKDTASWLVLAAGLLLAAPQTTPAADSPVYIDSEYGTLKEVIVGLPYGRSPDADAPWLQETLKILPPDEAEYTLATAGMSWDKMIHPVKKKSETELLEAENLALINVLEKLGVQVYRPTHLTEEFITRNYGPEVLANGFSQDFPRDNMIVIGNQAIEFNLRTMLRRADISGFQKILSEKFQQGNMRWFAMPHAPPLAIPSPDEPALEGGDLVILGKTILIGNTLNHAVGSNRTGCDWIQQVLGEEYTVVPVPLVEQILHLDCVLSIPREGLAIVCEEAFTEGIPACIRDWDLIKVPLADASRLAVNGLPVDEKNYIMSYNDHVSNDHIRSELEQRGITVHPVYFGTHNGQGGSIRCATQPLKRDPRFQ